MKIDRFLLKVLWSLPLIAGCVAIRVTAQNGPVDIKGQVRDPAGTGLSAATIQVRGTAAITASDRDGYFHIAAHPEDILVFSRVGYQEKELAAKLVSEQKGLVLLDPVDSRMDEVVVVGYGTVKKKDLTVPLLLCRQKTLIRAPLLRQTSSLPVRPRSAGGAEQR
ncbi:carboxypeptidase-like regulatory domain-containing protein [Niabella sp. CC-SYL272]|uniref:carboxypeptidase-like regulatory domain-containing protein n=1 Tax=Niabella agricola TaxID=2891571 RepID=UPI001F47E922|nr:carboxypeptidase-like regulatory domain-containing protein [Niabella agricola]MCF3108851.1 carboxypeptidase-like regulatory domain-containing protein [Niabella agricola]